MRGSQLATLVQVSLALVLSLRVIQAYLEVKVLLVISEGLGSGIGCFSVANFSLLLLVEDFEESLSLHLGLLGEVLFFEPELHLPGSVKISKESKLFLLL